MASNHPTLSQLRSWLYLLPFMSIMVFLLIDIEYIALRIRSPQATNQTETYMSEMLDDTSKGSELRRQQQDGSFLRKSVLITGFGLAFIGLILPGGHTSNILQRQKLMLIFLLYTLLSVYWSVAPPISLRRWVQFMGMLLLIWCAMRTTSAPQRLIQSFRWLFLSTLVLSLLIVMIKTESAVDLHGKWMGIFSHKNILGSVTFLTIAVWLPCLFSHENRAERYMAPLALLLAAWLAWQSDHKSAQVSIVTITMLWAILRTPVHPVVKLAITYCVMAIPTLYFLNMQAFSPALKTFVTEILGRNVTLTGRLPIWQGVWNSFSSHPFLGAGYDAFWTMSNLEALRLVFAVSKWPASHGHNGYLDVLNELGLVGGTLFLLILIQSVWRVMRIKDVQDSTNMAFILLLAGQLILNLTESLFCRSTDTVWIIFLFTYVSLARITNTEDVYDPRDVPQKNAMPMKMLRQ